ncbi:copper amine oxidase N-terminal domain-containing protein [Paenibacillus polymyxa]|uniref:copper amine oxidase N-terminal domain-containing protein n=1 Tax=Paenibacillus polymyxa TaxID=1406 RepID=UPI00069B1341|nr:copper amine oxidase N-terminal domain-containing protein [Paenibacillus polymyxa]MBE3650792.1 copper amine oxidase N-terminal domain-containing protein [Paenibacillus polymyxa]MBY7740288.1 copper amine oxidase N-terminal domain-containing protein [Paenibacillus polymyxa]MEE4580993.1 copper amine oxidase N-terminal domain-containing protein [Paenibacillus polymyxa]
MKKKFLMMFAMILIVSSLGQVASAAGKEVTVTVDAKKVNFPDGKPLLEESRVLIPVRFVSEALGAKVDYKNRTVLIKQSAKSISMKVNTSIVTSGDKRIFLDVPARLQKGRVYVPLRFVSEALGANVDWNSKKYLVTITTVGAITTPVDPKQPEVKPEEKPDEKAEEQTTTVNGNKPFEWDTKKTDLGKDLFKNNIRYSNGKVTFTVPDGAEAQFLSIQSGLINLKAGKQYTYSVGKGSINFARIYGKEDYVESYTLLLDKNEDSLKGQFKNLENDVIVAHDFVKNNKSVSTVGKLSDVVKSAQSL